LNKFEIGLRGWRSSSTEGSKGSKAEDEMRRRQNHVPAKWAIPTRTQPEKKCNNATTRVVIERNEGFQSATEVQQALKVKQI